jgi:hypothetical protein
MNGYYAQGVSISTAVVPQGWRDRMVAFRSHSSEPATGWCLEKHDLALSKLVARREKDYIFVEALLRADLLDAQILLERIETMEIPTALATQMRRWIAACVGRM